MQVSVEVLTIDFNDFNSYQFSQRDVVKITNYFDDTQINIHSNLVWLQRLAVNLGDKLLPCINSLCKQDNKVFVAELQQSPSLLGIFFEALLHMDPLECSSYDAGFLIFCIFYKVLPESGNDIVQEMTRLSISFLMTAQDSTFGLFADAIMEMIVS